MAASVDPHGMTDRGVTLTPTSFADLPGFAEDDHTEALSAFRRSAYAIVSGTPAPRRALEPDEALRRVCGAALRRPESPSRTQARRFFETHFTPHRIGTKGERLGFLTGYYEPEVEGSLTPSATFAAPILRRPAGLTWTGPGVAKRPFLDRAAIEAGIARGECEPVVWLRDWVEVFFVHVQGSAQVRLQDGTRLRLVYDGRNGHAYTSIGRRLVESGEIAADAMSLDRLKGWIRDHGQAVGSPGRDLMQSNRSYIFFRREAEALAPAEGPIGGAGLPLAPLRSIAIDRTLWPYGLPFFIEAELPRGRGAPASFRRLTIAQDTGSAIIGAARADLFIGSGEAAGRSAGDIRHPVGFTVLLPRQDSAR